MLLLVAVINFYLLFSSRDDKRKKLIIPRAEVSQRRIEENAWQAVGICERDEGSDGETLQSRSDMFWDVVVPVTERLIYPKAKFTPDYKKERTNLSSTSHEEKLLKIEELLREHGATALSPKGISSSISEIWDKSETVTSTTRKNIDKQHTATGESCSKSHQDTSKPDPRERTLNLLESYLDIRMHVSSDENKRHTQWSCLTVQVKNRRRLARVSTVAGRHLDPKFTEAVHCGVSKTNYCDRCVWIKENHFGMMVNVHDGTAPENERGYGPLWTFLDRHAHRSFVPNDPASSFVGKKRKLSDGPGHGEWEVASVDEPRSANLIVNGLRAEATPGPRVRCSPEILRQLENLIAQDEFSGIVKTKSEQEMNAVKEVLAVASEEDKANFKSLEESANLVIRLARDFETSLARKT